MPAPAAPADVSLMRAEDGRGVVSANGPQVLPGISSSWEWQVVAGNTWPQATIREIGRSMTRIIIRENENVKMKLSVAILFHL